MRQRDRMNPAKKKVADICASSNTSQLSANAPRPALNAPAVVGEKCADLSEVAIVATIQTPRAASSGATFESLNPTNGDVVGVHPICSKADVDAAVQPRTGADWWGALSVRGERANSSFLARRDYPSHRRARGVGAPGDGQAER